MSRKGADGLHALVKRAAMQSWQAKGSVLDAVAAAVEADERMVLDVVEVLAGQADCEHQREPLNRILTIFGRDPVDGPTLQAPDRCALVDHGEEEVSSDGQAAG